MKPGFAIHANAISTHVEATDRADAIEAYVRDAGYGSVDEAAAVCGQSTERFLDEIIVTTR